MNMGQSIAIKGELSGAEDLTLEGQVEGKINLPENVLTIGTSARINAEVIAKSIVVLGQLVGNVDRQGKVRAARGRVDAGQPEGAAYRHGRRSDFRGKGRDARGEGCPGRAGQSGRDSRRAEARTRRRLATASQLTVQQSEL